MKSETIKNNIENSQKKKKEKEANLIKTKPRQSSTRAYPGAEQGGGVSRGGANVSAIN